MRWISSINSTSPSIRLESMAARSPARSRAGPEVMRSELPSSWAMIIAMVVLPNPGGPANSTWSGATPRERAPPNTRSSCVRTFGWPMNSSSDLGRSEVSMSDSPADCCGSRSAFWEKPWPPGAAPGPTPGGSSNSVRSVSLMVSSLPYSSAAYLGLPVPI